MTTKMCETPEQEQPRAELARRIGAAWARSGCLAQERIEARLKRRFDGQKKRGLSDSSFNRYKDPTATALPDPAVLIALAQIFHVDEGETKEWTRLLDLAQAEERRRRASRGRRTTTLEPAQATLGHAAPDPAGCPPVPVSPVPGARMPSGAAAAATGVAVPRRGRRYHGAAAGTTARRPSPRSPPQHWWRAGRSPTRRGPPCRATGRRPKVRSARPRSRPPRLWGR
ncbi:hypothetical protein ACF1BU_29705 [Streptomyces sp. NPDC014724]|uniref:hypothetical protein n=1 Tax=unclassified Streptomyces TaxID=2593676 RepID=UPI0036FFE7F7